MNAVPSFDPAPDQDPDGAGQNDAVERLRGEGLALQAVLHGLCVSLARMSEVNREVVVSALDHAEGVRRTPSNRSPESMQAFGEFLGQLREAVLVYRDDPVFRR